jgi:hypothetical protein
MLPSASTPWKTCDDDDGALPQITAHVGFVDVENARLGVRIVGQDPHLAAGVALRLQARARAAQWREGR